MTTVSMALPASSVHTMPFGAQIEAGGVRFRLWSPGYGSPQIAIDDRSPVAMRPDRDGWFEHLEPLAQDGTRYAFVVANGLRVPDPASRFQPDVHGASVVVDPRVYRWKHAAWRGRPWHETVIYELHVGTFTAEGTYRAAASRLAELAALGITAVELMPLAEAPGAFNWGYDGVLPFAPEHRYGSIEDLKAFIDTAHEHGLMVFLDVVYNHFGPEGNYLHAYAPAFFTQRHHTPWGAAINVDGADAAMVREFFVHNALYWLEEYRFDGLRLDAVHAILDDSPRPFLHELAARVRESCRDRHVHLILENDKNDAALLGSGGYDAQWNDDVHHLLHVLLTGETTSYYRDYAEAPPALLGRALAQGFAYQGERSEHRGGAMRGSPSGALPPTAFVNFLQNHDQIGNRAVGERIGALASAAAVRAATMVVLLSPSIPLLFMGEEWSASTPFLFFAQFDGDLANAVREGRRSEFAEDPAFADAHARESIPDPGSIETVRRSTLRHDECARMPHRSHHEFVRTLLEIRQREIVPRLDGIGDAQAWYACFGRGGVTVSWRLADGSRLSMLANLCDAQSSLAGIVTMHGRRIATTGTVGEHSLGPWSVAVYLDS